MSERSPSWHLFVPKLITVLRLGYGPADLRQDVIAGLTVAIVALPLAMALGIASGSTPEKGLITAVILYWLGNTAVKGFAVTLGIGNIVSMFTAVTVTRTFLYALALKESESPRLRFFFGGKK